MKLIVAVRGFFLGLLLLLSGLAILYPAQARVAIIPTADGPGINKIDDSTVNNVSPGTVVVGDTLDVCFNVTISSPDEEYLWRFDASLPDSWTVNSLGDVPGTGCGNGHTSGVEAGNVIYWQTNSGCGDWSNGTYDFCANVTVLSCAGEAWSFPWNIIGDGYGEPPHSRSGNSGSVACQAPDLGGSYKDAPVLVTPGQVLTYRVVAANRGESTAEGVTMADPIPAHTTFRAIVSPPDAYYSPAFDQVEWAGTLPTDTEVSIVFTVDVEEGLACPTTIANVATINADYVDEVEVEAVTEVWDAPYLALNLEADDGGFQAGGTKSSWEWGRTASGPNRAHSGARSWATNLDGDYNLNERSSLTSPPIDLSLAGNDPTDPLLLEWWQYLVSETDYDYARVDVRGGGMDWTTVYGPLSGYVDSTWARHEVNISAFAGVPDFQVRFFFTSDSIVQYAGWYIDDLSIHQCSAPLPGLYLSPAAVDDAGYSGATRTIPLTLNNNTGAAGTFTLRYSVEGSQGILTGPPQIEAAAGASAVFDVRLSVDTCAEPGDLVAGTVRAAGNGYADSTVVSYTVVADDTWLPVPGSEPLWAGVGEASDGCTALNAAGEWVTYELGEGTYFEGLWGYNHATNTWFRPDPDNTPAARWMPDWAYDPVMNRCYLTGGSSHFGSGGDLADAYVFDPVANTFTAMGSFTTARNHHSSWVGTVDGLRYLCIGNGFTAVGDVLQSTQCYDLAQAAPGAWSAENAQLGTAPTPAYGAADGVLHAPGGDQFWYVDGAIDLNWTATDQTAYWDDADNAWHLAGHTGVVRWRVEGEFFDGAFYLVGGTVAGGNVPTDTVVKGTFNGTSWTWALVPDLANARQDTVVAITGDALWSVDGRGSESWAYVERLEIAPECVPADHVVYLPLIDKRMH